MPARLTRSVRARQMGGLSLRIRAQWDYLSFVLTRIWPLVVGLAGVLAAVVTLAPIQWGLIISAIAAAVSFGMFIRDVVEARRQWSRLQCVSVVSPFPVADVQLPLGYEGAVYLAIQNRGTMLVHPAADRLISEGPIPVELDGTTYRLPAELREIRFS